jgi:membrane-associated phospholipid phosphatase
MIFSVHWVSDVFAGVLMGYAAGKVTGYNFKQLLKKTQKNDKNSKLETLKQKNISFYILPYSAIVKIRL